MNSFREEAINFKKADQQSLYGVIHYPRNPNGLLVILLNIGMHYRVSHSRLFVLHARYLQEAGYTVARFDTAGIGYSQGEYTAERTLDLFDLIQTGLFKNDVLEISRYLKQKIRPARIFLIGLCGGALSAIYAAAEDEIIDGIVFTAGPITLTSAQYSLSALHPFEAKQLMRSYLGKIINPKAWIRFFSGKTSYRDIYNSIKVRLTDKSVVNTPGQNNKENSDADSAEFKGEIFNQAFLQAFEALLKSGKSILFLLPELDRATYDFDKIFLPILKDYDTGKKYYSIQRIEKADHTFTQPESVRQMFEISLKWLNSVSNI